MKRARYDAFFGILPLFQSLSALWLTWRKKFMNSKLFNSFRRTNVAKRWAMALWHPRLGRFLVSSAPSSSHCLAHLGLFERLTNKAKRYLLLTWVEIWKRYYNSLASDKLGRFRLTFSSAVTKKKDLFWTIYGFLSLEPVDIYLFPVSRDCFCEVSALTVFLLTVLLFWADFPGSCPILSPWHLGWNS